MVGHPSKASRPTAIRTTIAALEGAATTPIHLPSPAEVEERIYVRARTSRGSRVVEELLHAFDAESRKRRRNYFGRE